MTPAPPLALPPRRLAADTARLAAPVVVEQFLFMLLGWSQLYLAGRLEPSPKAAMTAVATVFLLAPGAMVGIFASRSPDAAAIAVRMLVVVAAVQPFNGLLIIFGGLLRGVGDTRFPLAIDLTVGLSLRVGATWAASAWLGWGVVAIWSILCLDLAVRGLCMFARFLSGRWKTARV